MNTHVNIDNKGEYKKIANNMNINTAVINHIATAGPHLDNSFAAIIAQALIFLDLAVKDRRRQLERTRAVTSTITMSTNMPALRKH